MKALLQSQIALVSLVQCGPTDNLGNWLRFLCTQGEWERSMASRVLGFRREEFVLTTLNLPLKKCVHQR